MKKIIAIGIIGMFLLMGFSTLSIGAKDAVNINKVNGCKLITNLMTTLNLNVILNQKNQEIVYVTKDAACTKGDWTEQLKLPSSADVGLNGLFGCSVCIDGNYLIIGAQESGSIQTGAAYIFKRDGTNWIQEAKLTASDGTIWDQFGFSVSISGDYAIVGAPGQYDSTGAAYVFKRDGTTWTQQQKLTGGTQGAFGISVSIEDDYALVGAHGDDGLRGSAYVFKRYGTSWIEEDKLISSGLRYPWDLFGAAVSIYDEYAIIGAIEFGIGKGSAYVFKRSGTTWAQQQKLTASDGALGNYFGCGVSIYSDYALVGALGNNGNTGATYVYKNDGASWTEKDKLTASDGAPMDQFGNSVSICDEFALVGSYGDDGYKGSAYIYKLTGETWDEKQKLIASDGTLEDNFGWSVFINGDYALIGAPYDDVNTNDDGSAYVFAKPPTLVADLDCGGSLSWTDIEPGATVTGEFYVENIGGEGTLLNWEIESHPNWGTWTFTPNDGTGLLPGNVVTVEVEVVAPDDPNTEFTGGVKVINSDDPTDYCTIPVYLKTPVNNQQSSPQSQQNSLSQNLVNLLKFNLINKLPLLTVILQNMQTTSTSISEEPTSYDVSPIVESGSNDVSTITKVTDTQTQPSTQPSSLPSSSTTQQSATTPTSTPTATTIATTSTATTSKSSPLASG